MKILIASDIHGDAICAKKLVEELKQAYEAISTNSSRKHELEEELNVMKEQLATMDEFSPEYRQQLQSIIKVEDEIKEKAERI